MITIKYFVMAEKDQCEGRGGLEETGIYFLNYQDALEFTVMRGHVSSEGHSELIKEKTINVFDSLLEYREQSKTKLKEQALAKLTLKEKQALGLI